MVYLKMLIKDLVMLDRNLLTQFLKEIVMSGAVNSKPLNMAERKSTIEEFSHFCQEEKERRMNSGEGFDENAFEQAKELTLRKLQILEDEGWV